MTYNAQNVGIFPFEIYLVSKLEALYLSQVLSNSLVCDHCDLDNQQL